MMNRKAARRARRSRRMILTVALMALVAIVSIGATVAYLTDKTETITNTFTVGNIDIALTETGADNNAKSFKMVPGNTIAKDPKVTVTTGSEDCWLFVKVIEDKNLAKFIEYSVDSNWEPLGVAYPGVYYYKNTVPQGTAISVLTGDAVKVSDKVTKADMDGLATAGNPTLSFKAYACQKANGTATFTATEAWAKVAD